VAAGDKTKSGTIVQVTRFTKRTIFLVFNQIDWVVGEGGRKKRKKGKKRWRDYRVQYIYIIYSAVFKFAVENVNPA